ncbi:hypothetical protein ACGFZG_31330 [Streptomyces antibioticus]|uniref:hypothetical protein n=1 Tax=Streptomyces TaxID=1883 RepID=UPI00158780A5|nr:hypothetical protein [Streptomyces sp. CAI-85]MBO7936906.1 hypothetical protein [Streptomyces sp. S9]NUV64038.1 hypothetical protein [Streptomyces sp. CAI-85]
MSSTARRVSRGRAWLRAVVLLLALLAPGAAAEVSVASVAAEVVEYDVAGPVLRPAPGVRRPAVPPSPVPPPPAPPAAPAARPGTERPAPRGAPYALVVSRTVVLRC